MKKILVIEDDDQVRLVLEVALKRSGYDIAVTVNGEEGIQRAREWLPDLVLCDINMPVMDGRAVLKAMRNDPALANRQFVLMTGDQKRDRQREGMDLGADDYLPKPFEIDELITCVKARLRRSEMYQRLEDGMLKRHANMFRGTLPHEIITPLNGILGFAEILKEDLGKIPQEEALHMLINIETSARRLHRTLMNFLALMSLENSADDPKSAPTRAISAERAAQVVIQVSQDMAGNAERTNDLTVTAESLSPNTDETTLKTIVQHLVENACGYSAAATPIKVQFKSENGRPTLRVEDHGRGMTPEQIDQIGVFTQFDRKRYEQQGLGIGLTLVRRLVERQGGVLKFESMPGRGTTAIVEFK
jgi:two-component system, sensor histidine kinase and response regulator